jgi:hypothetical protein
MNLCVICEAPQLESAKYCSECGAQLEQGALVSQVAEAAEAAEVKQKVDVSESLSFFQRIRANPDRLAIGAGATAVILILILAFVFSQQDSSSSTEMQASVDSSAAASENATSSSSGSLYTSKIPTYEIVSTFSSKLGVQINQDDPSRGVTFPSVSKQIDIWSAPYVTLLIYPNSEKLKADDKNFQQDFTSLNTDSWESCLNVIAVYPTSMQSQIDSATNTWCTGSTASPTPSATASPTPSATASPTPSASTASTSSSFYYTRGYNAILNNTQQGLIDYGYYGYLNSQNQMTTTNANSWCAHVMQLIEINTNATDGWTQGNIADWEGGCAAAAVKL